MCPREELVQRESPLSDSTLQLPNLARMYGECAASLLHCIFCAYADSFTNLDWHDLPTSLRIYVYKPKSSWYMGKFCRSSMNPCPKQEPLYPKPPSTQQIVLQTSVEADLKAPLPAWTRP